MTQTSNNTNTINDEERIIQIIQKYSHELSNGLQPIEDYLEAESPPKSSLTPKKIADTTENLMGSRSSEPLILLIWLRYKIDDALDIIKLPAKEKRLKILKILQTYKFEGSSLKELLKVCCKEIDHNLDQIQDMIEFINEKHASAVQRFFLKSLDSHPGKDIKQELRGLMADYQKYPEGSLERIIQHQLIFAYTQLFSQGKQLLKLKFPHFQDKSNLKWLKESYEKRTQQIIEDSHLGQIWKKISNSKRDAFEGLQQLKSKIIPLKVFDIERLMEKNEKFCCEVEDQNVLIIIGNQKSGKTTTCLKILGYQLQLRKLGNLITHAPVGDLKEKHDRLRISPEVGASVPYMCAFLVPVDSVTQLMVIDTPTLGDSSGAETDIANQLSLMHNLSRARSLRIVVIIAYEQLKDCRMRGLVKLCERVSTFLPNKDSIESIAFLFSKVPKDKINEIPAIIESNMESLNKKSETLMCYFEKIQASSREIGSYIDPVQTDFSILLGELTSMPPITDVKGKIQSRFTNNTDRRIKKFAEGQMNHVKRFFSENNFSQSKFHLDFLERLMKILVNHEAVKSIYGRAIQFIEEVLERENQLLKKEIIDLASFGFEAKEIRLKGQKITAIRVNFQKHVPFVSKIQSSIDEARKIIIARSDSLPEDVPEIVNTISKFSQLFGNSIVTEVLNVWKKKCEIACQESLKNIKAKDCQSLQKSMKCLQKLQYLCSQFDANAASKIEATLTFLKKEISDEIQSDLAYLDGKIINSSLNLIGDTVKIIKSKTSFIKKILAISILRSNREIHQRLTIRFNALNKNCNQLIGQFSQIDVSWGQNTTQFQKNLDRTMEKKEQIEIWMQIVDADENLSNFYQRAKIDVLRRAMSEDNFTRLKERFQQYQKKDEVKKSVQSMLSFSKLFGSSEYDKNLGVFRQLFGAEIKSRTYQVQSLKLKFYEINQKSFEAIAFLRNVVQAFTLISEIKELGLEESSKQLKDAFGTKIRQPFKEIQTNLTSKMKNNLYENHFLDDRLEIFSNYALKLESILSNKEYDSIKEEMEIKDSLNNLCQEIVKPIQMDSSRTLFSDNNPNSLKKHFAFLLPIKQKKIICEYLWKRLNFNVPKRIEGIQLQLTNHHSRLEKDLQLSEYAQQDRQQELLRECRLYREIEDLQAQERPNRFGFRQLQQRYEAYRDSRVSEQSQHHRKAENL